MQHAEPADARADRLLALGFQLADNVRELDPAAYVRPLRRLSRDELEHLAVLLACCIDITKTRGELLAWWFGEASAVDAFAVRDGGPDVADLVAERFDLAGARRERPRR